MKQIIETARKYDRSIVAIAVGIGTLVAIYLAIGNRINSVVAGTPVVQELKTQDKVQDKINEQLMNGLDGINKRLDTMFEKLADIKNR